MLRSRCLVVVLLMSVRAVASESAGLVAVMPLDVRVAHLDEEGRVALEESLRSEAGAALSPRGYTVLTGATTLAVLRDNGVDPEKVCEASCALDAARELHASFFVSGTVTKSEGVFIAYVRLIEQSQGRQVATVQLEGATVKALRDQLHERAEAFFSVVSGETGDRAEIFGGVVGGLVAAPSLKLHFQLSPEGARRLGSRRLEAEFLDQGRAFRCPAPITESEGCNVVGLGLGALGYRLILDGQPDAPRQLWVGMGSELKLVPTLSAVPWVAATVVGLGMAVAGFAMGSAEGGLGKESAGPVLLVAFGLPITLLCGGIAAWFGAGPDLEFEPLTPFDERRPTANEVNLSRK